MTDQEFLAQIEDLIEAPPGSLRGTEPLQGLEHWDSLAVVGFIAMVDENFGVTLSANKIAQATSVADLVALLGDRVAHAA